jgi:hypothetical protein
MQAFSSWHPLTRETVAHHAPDSPCVLQVRVAKGVLDYPRGRSAMILYTYAERTTSEALEVQLGDELDEPGARGFGPLRVRWLVPRPGDSESCRQHLGALLDRFEARFGARPRLQPSPSDATGKTP